MLQSDLFLPLLSSFRHDLRVPAYCRLREVLIIDAAATPLLSTRALAKGSVEAKLAKASRHIIQWQTSPIKGTDVWPYCARKGLAKLMALLTTGPGHLGVTKNAECAKQDEVQRLTLNHVGPFACINQSTGTGFSAGSRCVISISGHEKPRSAHFSHKKVHCIPI